MSLKLPIGAFESNLFGTTGLGDLKWFQSLQRLDPAVLKVKIKIEIKITPPDPAQNSSL